MSIVLEAVGVRAGNFHLENLDLSVETSGYSVLMGRTGCGKTTLLETICGLKQATAGRIALAGVDVTDAHPAERGVGYVPQDGALFPTMTVREHLGFSPSIRRWSRTEARARVAELATALRLEPLLERRPRGLSGGERQRVALGRALASRPAVLCLDEPLSALDDETREEMYEVLRTLRHHTPVTTLHVTHSAHEAEVLADTIFRLDERGIREI